MAYQIKYRAGYEILVGGDLGQDGLPRGQVCRVFRKCVVLFSGSLAECERFLAHRGITRRM